MAGKGEDPQYGIQAEANVRALETVIQGAQGNFDHLSGEHIQNAKVFNQAMVLIESILNDLLAKYAELEARIAALE